MDSEPKKIVLNNNGNDNVLDIKKYNDTSSSNQSKNVSDSGHINDVLNLDNNDYIISDAKESNVNLDANRRNDVLDTKTSERDLNIISSESISKTKLEQKDLVSNEIINHIDSEQSKIISSYVQSGKISKLGITEWCTLYNYPE